jgi:spore coat polysaccharide biosynthesis protein SpsF (cytidylyltransferase family)
MYKKKILTIKSSLHQINYKLKIKKETNDKVSLLFNICANESCIKKSKEILLSRIINHILKHNYNIVLYLYENNKFIYKGLIENSIETFFSFSDIIILTMPIF